VFKGIAEFSTDPPEIITGDNYESRAGTLFDELIRCKVNIFNISKINSEVRGGKSPRIKRLSEYIGESYFDYLAGLKDLVLLMDESHRYRASAGVRAINELQGVCSRVSLWCHRDRLDFHLCVFFKQSFYLRQRHGREMTPEVFAVRGANLAPAFAVLFSVDNQKVDFHDIFRFPSGRFHHANDVGQGLIELRNQVLTHHFSVARCSSLTRHEQLSAKANRAVTEAFWRGKVSGIE
jgi:hypothetical protein